MGSDPSHTIGFPCRKGKPGEHSSAPSRFNTFLSVGNRAEAGASKTGF